MHQHRPTRRRFVAAVGTIAGTALAGCVEEGPDEQGPQDEHDEQATNDPGQDEAGPEEGENESVQGDGEYTVTIVVENEAGEAVEEATVEIFSGGSSDATLVDEFNVEANGTVRVALDEGEYTVRAGDADNKTEEQITVDEDTEVTITVEESQREAGDEGNESDDGGYDDE